MSIRCNFSSTSLWPTLLKLHYYFLHQHLLNSHPQTRLGLGWRGTEESAKEKDLHLARKNPVPFQINILNDISTWEALNKVKTGYFHKGVLIFGHSTAWQNKLQSKELKLTLIKIQQNEDYFIGTTKGGIFNIFCAYNYRKSKCIPSTLFI